MSNHVLRIHPAIGFARVGNSEEFYLGPETIAGMPSYDAKGVKSNINGGLPIQPGTHSTTITSDQIRDSHGKLKRQAARFRIYAYDDSQAERYPNGENNEIVIGSALTLNGENKIVKDIIWTVHLANKKANCWRLEDNHREGAVLYQNNQLPAIRNPNFKGTADPAAPVRLKELIIDAGPRAINSAAGHIPVCFDTTTQATFTQAGQIQSAPDYPIAFPPQATQAASDDFDQYSEAISTLGELQTETNGRLLVLGAYGKAQCFTNEGLPSAYKALEDDIDNNNWFDDTADGPVYATLLFEDGSYHEITTPAWVVTTDPAYAPQITNAVTLWDDLYDTWLREPLLSLNPSIFSDNQFKSDYQPSFEQDVQPMLVCASLQRWVTTLSDSGVIAHHALGEQTAKPPAVGASWMTIMRKPSELIADESEKIAEQQRVKAMPLSLGDAGQSFLSINPTQYTFLEKWSHGLCEKAPTPEYGFGEQLDKNILMNCLGGRYSPGIDMTFIIRDTHLYNTDWKNRAVGPFRFNTQAIDYNNVTKTEPVLGVGYIPFRTHGVEPGDICKFMAIPWHTDYNSCATHLPDPNPGGAATQNGAITTANQTLYWSWPAQRPVAVYAFNDVVKNNNLINLQKYSLRGPEALAFNHPSNQTDPADITAWAAEQVGRYQDRKDILTHWHKIGVVMQASSITGCPSSLKDATTEKVLPSSDVYLEVQSQLEGQPYDSVLQFPNLLSNRVTVIK